MPRQPIPAQTILPHNNRRGALHAPIAPHHHVRVPAYALIATMHEEKTA